jgi:hypothetical protein
MPPSTSRAGMPTISAHMISSRRVNPKRFRQPGSWSATWRGYHPRERDRSYSLVRAFFIIASEGSGPLNPPRYSSRIGAKHS